MYKARPVFLHSIRFSESEAHALKTAAKKRTNGNISRLVRDLVNAGIKESAQPEA